MNRDQIREVFLAHGFTVKPGNDDLKPYVYQAAEALLALAATEAAEPVALNNDTLEDAAIICDRHDEFGHPHRTTARQLRALAVAISDMDARTNVGESPSGYALVPLEAFSAVTHAAPTDSQAGRFSAIGFVRPDGSLHKGCPGFAEPDGWQVVYVHDASAPPAASQAGMDAVEADCHGLDTAERVRFYEHDFYVLSNFSAFNLRRHGFDFPTSEHAYHAEKFRNFRGDIAELIARAPSAHEAFKIAERYRHNRTPEWDEIKVGVMREILREKARQHEYVRRKLLATGDRELVEDSWRDDFWGWGPNRDGTNMLGKLWMEVRAELRAALSTSTGRAAE